jgi:hypothetical protein
MRQRLTHIVVVLVAAGALTALWWPYRGGRWTYATDVWLDVRVARQSIGLFGYLDLQAELNPREQWDERLPPPEKAIASRGYRVAPVGATLTTCMTFLVVAGVVAVLRRSPPVVVTVVDD